MSVIRPRPEVPKDLPELMHSLCYEVVKLHPPNILSFAADHFKRLLQERERQKLIDAATAIQRDVRGFQARKKYKNMKALAHEQKIINYEPFFIDEHHIGTDQED